MSNFSSSCQIHLEKKSFFSFIFLDGIGKHMLERQSCWLDLWTTTQRRDVAPRLIGVVAKEAAGFTNVVDTRMRLINLVSWKKPTSLFFSPPRNWDEISPLWDGTVIRNPCTMDSLQTFSRKKQQKIQNKWNEINNNNNFKKCNWFPHWSGRQIGTCQCDFFLHAARVWTPHMHNFFFQQLAECDSTQNKMAMNDKGYCCLLDDEDGPSLFRPLNETWLQRVEKNKEKISSSVCDGGWPKLSPLPS